MLRLLCYLCLVNSLCAQIDSSFRNRQELFLGLNVVSYSKGLGLNLGYTRHMANSKRTYFRLDAQYFNQFFNNTYSAEHSQEEFFYKDLMINNITLNGMFSYRFYQKNKNRFYFEMGVHLGVHIWQQRKGEYYERIGYYQYEKEEIKKNYFILPSNTGIDLGCGIRLGKRILLKPDFRIGIFNFVRLSHQQKIWNEPILLASFNVAYLL